MRRTNAVVEKVEAPSRGLLTRTPSSVASEDNRGIVAGENVRAERGVLSSAPGYERVISSPLNLDSPANLIFQANVLDPDVETQTTPFIGTDTSLYVIRRRASALVCDIGGGGGRTCDLTTAIIGDSGRVGSDLATVAALVKSWSPDTLVHVGDIVYADGGADPALSDFEEEVGQYFGADFIGGYNGPFGPGPLVNKFFPTLGNHDWDDGGIFNYEDFFTQARNPNARYYTYKRGPVHWVHLDSGGFNPGSIDPDGYGIGSAQAVWLESVLAASDCPWLFVVVHFPGWASDINYYPGIVATQSLAPLFAKYNVTAVLSGHAHNAEHLVVPAVAYDTGTRDVTQLIFGNSGHSLRAFHDPVSPFQIWGDPGTYYGAGRMYATRTTAKFDWVDTTNVVRHSVTFSNPRPNSGICYVGDAAKSVFTLEVLPDSASVEVGNSWPFRAIANYVDGSTEDVTDSATWSSSDDTIAGVGVTTGIAVGNTPGIATITATYKTQSASGTLHVLHSCIDDPTEVVFCLSRSHSMSTYASGVTRLDAVKEAVGLGIDAFDPTIDYMGLVSFAGIFVPQTEDVTLDAALTNDFDSVKSALSLLVPDGSTGIPSGLDLAHDELTGPRHVDGRLRAVVLVVDWPADVTNPGGTSTSEPAAITAAMAAAQVSADNVKAITNTTLIVVAYNVPTTYRASLQALATPGYFFDLHTPDELKTMMASLPHLMCFYNGDYYYYGTQTCGNPVPDYTGLFDWDVVRGCIDLAGVGPGGETSGIAWDPRPGHGMYLDLIGTNVDNSPDFKTTAAKIVTKNAYPIVTGKHYQLTFKMCSYTAAVYWTDALLKADDGTVFGTLRVTPPANGPFVTYTLDIVSSPATGNARLIFDHQAHINGAIPNDQEAPWLTTKQGNLLDDVRLFNVTDSVEIFFNDFDNENPCSI